ncbi:hypothetical protein TOPH_09205, partial [Tolypocladium ophioglossoides CBS 100239]
RLDTSRTQLRPLRRNLRAFTNFTRELRFCGAYKPRNLSLIFIPRVLNIKNLGGRQLPDPGFFDTRKDWVSTEATDIFSLGSVFYTIMTGHWPHWVAGEERQAYMQRVDDLFLNGEFPSIDRLQGGIVIQGCWMDRYDKASCIVEDYRNLDCDGLA